MTKEILRNTLKIDLKKSIEENRGLTVFAKQRSKFEGWLKVELINALSEYGAIPEFEHIDIVLQKYSWAIELKTINTNYRCREENIITVTRPITKNIEDIIQDVNKLRDRSYCNKYIIFIAFPFSENCLNSELWNRHINKLKDYIALEDKIDFNFNSSKIFGTIYWGEIIASE